MVWPRKFLHRIRELRCCNGGDARGERKLNRMIHTILLGHFD